MPEIFSIECSTCELTLPTGWGGCMYVEDSTGKRIICPHPGEHFTMDEILGKNASEKLVRERTGFNSDCICLTCFFQFEADLRDETENPYRPDIHQTKNSKDKRECPRCCSTKVKTVFELIDKPCPKCKKGVITKIEIAIA